jgi:hypothetical protein
MANDVKRIESAAKGESENRLRMDSRSCGYGGGRLKYGFQIRTLPKFVRHGRRHVESLAQVPSVRSV